MHFHLFSSYNYQIFRNIGLEMVNYIHAIVVIIRNVYVVCKATDPKQRPGRVQ